jgi:predicted DNA binding CopG/RHH family protein
MKSKKKADPYDVILDDEEKEIEESLNFEKGKRASNVKAKIASLSEAASNHLRKNKQINIRISEYDLQGLKEVAAYEGLPYQTLISSLLHKFVSGHTIHR